MKWKFIEVRPFLTNRDACFASDEDFARFQAALIEDPRRWGVIPGAAPLRKARWGDESSGKGKRGGCRVIYLQVPEARTIVLLTVYPKSRRDNLTPDEARLLASIARQLRDELIEKARGGRL